MVKSIITRLWQEAPGTCASIITTAFWILCRVYIWALLAQIVLSLVLMVVALYGVCRWVPLTGKDQDPSWFVLDEVVGMSVSLWGASTPVDIFCALILFRFFDITKIMGITACEKIAYPWGIVCDDIVAGVYTIGVRLLCAYLPYG